MTKILNLTKHQATLEQKKQGVVDVENSTLIRELFEFETLPTEKEVNNRIDTLIKIACDTDSDLIMLGGPAFFVSRLHQELLLMGRKLVYPFIKKEENKFKHIGFVY